MSEGENKPKKFPDWLVPGYPSLRGDDTVGEAAVNGQLLHYPKVVRSMADPPLVGQRLSCISFMLFKEPRKLSNGVPVYGYLKCRGNWADESQASHEATKIIKDVDSKYQIRVAPTGEWVPITEEEAFNNDKLEVKTSEDQVCLRDEAAKEKLSEQRRIKKEIMERESELRTDGDIYDDPSSLTFYAMRRVTEKTLMESRDRQRNQLESTHGTIKKVQLELKKLEGDHPEYIDQWVDRYNQERAKAGIPNYVPSEEQDEEHDKAMDSLTLEEEGEGESSTKAEDSDPKGKGKEESDLKEEGPFASEKGRDDRPSFFTP